MSFQDGFAFACCVAALIGVGMLIGDRIEGREAVRRLTAATLIAIGATAALLLLMNA